MLLLMDFKAVEILWRDFGKLTVINSVLFRTVILGILYYNVIGIVIKNTLDICNIIYLDLRWVRWFEDSRVNRLLLFEWIWIYLLYFIILVWYSLMVKLGIFVKIR